MSDNAPGLIIQSLEIGKALAEHDRAILHAKGMCMYPLVRAGDRLHIRSRCVEQVQIGEIAVCRRSGLLVCHRTVGKGNCNGRPYIVTRSDRNSRDADPFTYDENLLGIVTFIERKGRLIDPYAAMRQRRDRTVASLRRALMDRYGAWKGRLLAVLTTAQRTVAYRTAARFLSKASRRPPQYEVRVWKEPWRKLDLYMPLKPEEFDVNKPVFQGCPLDRWMLVLHHANRQEPAVQATFQSSRDKWRLKDLHIRSRYRGMGLGKDLLLKAEEIFRRSGITNFETDGASLE